MGLLSIRPLDSEQYVGASENESGPNFIQLVFVSFFSEEKFSTFLSLNLMRLLFFYRICKAAEETSLDKILRTEDMFESIELLTYDLLYKIEPGHCYTIVTDPLYSVLLKPKLFSEISRSTYFVIRVRFNEDMLSPRNRTVNALKEAHNAGCRCYLIYMANGIQMSRFFRFIDRLVKIR